MEPKSSRTTVVWIIVIALVLIAVIVLALRGMTPSAGTSDTGATATTSDSGQNIAPSMLQVLTPNGGETLATGQTYTITWNEEGLDKVAISLVNGGKEFGTMGPVSASDKTFAWTVPDMSGWVKSGVDPKNFKIFISDASADAGANALTDTSDTAFTITSSSSTAASSSASVKAAL